MRRPTRDNILSSIQSARSMREWLRNCVRALESGDLSDADVFAFVSVINGACAVFDHGRRRRLRPIVGERSRIMFARRPVPLQWLATNSEEGDAPRSIVETSVNLAESFVDLAEYLLEALGDPKLDLGQRKAFDVMIARAFSALQKQPT